MRQTGDRLGRALAQARAARGEVGREIRDARLNAGLSQVVAARAVQMSHAQLGRIERAELRGLTVKQASRACAAVGLKLVVRTYPDGDPIRDAGHAALLRRFSAVLPVGVRWRTEVPMPIAGDLRSWDAIATFHDGALAIEAEMRLRDPQALDRRIALKQRDAEIDRVLLLINDSEANRRAIRASRESLRSRLPLDGREILRAVRRGRVPHASGILLL